MDAGRSAVFAWLLLAAAEPDSAPQESSAASFTALGISVSHSPPAGIGSQDAEVEYFVRWEPGENLDSMLARGKVIATNEAHGDRLFLLGAAPGTYVAVAAAYRRSRTGSSMPLASGHPSKNVTVSFGFDPFASEDVYRTYFARDFIESTTVVVEPDSFVWAGELEIKQHGGISKGDSVQLRFQEVLEGKAAKRSGLLRVMTGTFSYRGALRGHRRDAATEAKFLEKAWKKLRKTEWAPLFERRMATLRAALPADP